MRLVEETETHILVRLLLLLLLGLFLGLLGSGTTRAAGSSTASSGTTSRATRGDGGKLLGTRGDQL
jgi:hypothetical protein